MNLKRELKELHFYLRDKKEDKDLLKFFLMETFVKAKLSTKSQVHKLLDNNWGHRYYKTFYYVAGGYCLTEELRIDSLKEKPIHVDSLSVNDESEYYLRSEERRLINKESGLEKHLSVKLFRVFSKVKNFCKNLEDNNLLHIVDLSGNHAFVNANEVELIEDKDNTIVKTKISSYKTNEDIGDLIHQLDELRRIHLINKNINEVDLYRSKMEIQREANAICILPDLNNK